jgi:hypothetical protein
MHARLLYLFFVRTVWDYANLKIEHFLGQLRVRAKKGLL